VVGFDKTGENVNEELYWIQALQTGSLTKNREYVSKFNFEPE